MEELHANRANGTRQKQTVNNLTRTVPNPSRGKKFNARFSRCEWALDLFMKFDCRQRWRAVAWEPECRNWPGGSLSLSRNPWSLAAPPLCPACSNIILNCYIIMVIIRAKGGKKEWGRPTPPPLWPSAGLHGGKDWKKPRRRSSLNIRIRNSCKTTAENHNTAHW